MTISAAQAAAIERALSDLSDDELDSLVSRLDPDDRRVVLDAMDVADFGGLQSFGGKRKERRIARRQSPRRQRVRKAFKKIHSNKLTRGFTDKVLNKIPVLKAITVPVTKAKRKIDSAVENRVKKRQARVLGDFEKVEPGKVMRKLKRIGKKTQGVRELAAGAAAQAGGKLAAGGKVDVQAALASAPAAASAAAARKLSSTANRLREAKGPAAFKATKRRALMTAVARGEAKGASNAAPSAAPSAAASAAPKRPPKGSVAVMLDDGTVHVFKSSEL